MWDPKQGQTRSITAELTMMMMMMIQMQYLTNYNNVSSSISIMDQQMSAELSV